MFHSTKPEIRMVRLPAPRPRGCWCCAVLEHALIAACVVMIVLAFEGVQP